MEWWRRVEIEFDMGMDIEDIDVDRSGMSLYSGAMMKRAMDIVMATSGGQLASMFGT